MLKKLLTVAVNALCVVAILFSLVAAAVLFTTPRGQAPSLLGYSFMTVLTGSMEPAIPAGSLIVVRKTDPAAIAVGDVISYYTTIGGHAGLINTHRVTEITADESGVPIFRTRGDANPSDDPSSVSSTQLVGKVIITSGGLGTFVGALRQPYIFLPVVILPLLILILSCVRRVYRLAKEEIGQAAQELEDQDHDQP